MKPHSVKGVGLFTFKKVAEQEVSLLFSFQTVPS